MGFNITNFKNQLPGGGARPSLFEVTLSFPALSTGDDIRSAFNGLATQVGASQKITFMAKATAIPTSTVAPIEVPYFGRKVKFAGNRTFPEWTITVINDEDFLIRTAFESWLAGINQHEENKRTYSEAISGGYQCTGTVTQYDKQGNPLKIYEFVNVFPSEVSPIELSWASENEIEEFTVTLQYDYWKNLSNTVSTGSSSS